MTLSCQIEVGKLILKTRTVMQTAHDRNSPGNLSQPTGNGMGNRLSIHYYAWVLLGS